MSGISRYHVVQGSKLFWLVPPTDDNLKKYEEWVLSGKQSDIFFGDIVENCGRFEIPQGGTFFIPSGWIHGVYTPQDSIVFGGNFLHSFSIEKQLQVAHIEEVTRVPTKFRFPFFTEMLWYALDRYIHCLTGRTHLDLPEEEKRRMRLEKGENIDPNKEVLKVVSSNAGAASGAATPGSTATATAPQVHLTAMELQGLKFIVMYLHHLPHSKKNIPLMLPDPISVVKDIRALVTEHANDCPEKAVTGKYILRWTESDDVDGGLAKRPRKHLPKLIPGTTIERERKKPGPKPGSTRQKLEQKSTMASPRVPSGTRRRRVRCRNCEACLGSDCRACQYCKDMIKYGGPGKMKQTCEKVGFFARFFLAKMKQERCYVAQSFYYRRYSWFAAAMHLPSVAHLLVLPRLQAGWLDERTQADQGERKAGGESRPLRMHHLPGHCPSAMRPKDDRPGQGQPRL